MKDGKTIWWIILIVIAVVIVWQFYWTDEKTEKSKEKLSQGELDCMRKEMSQLNHQDFELLANDNFSENSIRALVIEKMKLKGASLDARNIEDEVRQTMQGVNEIRKNCKNA